MSLFSRKTNKIEAMLSEYFSLCDNCIQLFQSAIDIYFSEGLSTQFEKATYTCNKAESAADSQRRSIEKTLYGKALLPDSRGDLLGLIEVFDKIPNEAETVLFSLLCQKIEIPQALHAPFLELVQINIEAYQLARQAVTVLFENPKNAPEATRAVAQKESESDRLERIVILELFSNDFPTEQRLLIRDVVLQVGEISDRAENTADRIDIIAIKRQV